MERLWEVLMSRRELEVGGDEVIIGIGNTEDYLA